jgi:signal transduction histidine kinase
MSATPSQGLRMNMRCRARHAWAHSRRALAHSLRVRLVALFVLLALAMAAVFLGGMQYALSIGWRDAARPLVMDYVDKLAAEIGSPPSVERAQALVQRLPLRVTISGPLVNWRSHPKLPDVAQHLRDSDRWSQEEHLLERKTADGHRIQFALSAAAWNDRPRFIGWVTLTLLLLFTALAYRRVRRLLRPLDDIRAGALRFGAGDFTQPIAVRHAHHPDELGELAATINTMASDIQQMLDAKRSLLLAISHELRSPLTRARLNTELLPETEALQSSREALLRDLALMRDLVTDLLESERLSARHAALHCEAVDLKSLAHEVVASLGQTVQQELDAALPTLQLDPARMRLLLRNLLDNALRHSQQASQAPVLHLRATVQGGVELRVRDFGAGVPVEQLPQMAQAFHRPDAARSRDDGGVGLGLYLCKLVALAHGGSFTIANASPGLVITVTLPASSPHNAA